MSYDTAKHDDWAVTARDWRSKKSKGHEGVFQISCDDIKAAYEAQKKAFMAKSENAGKKFRDFNGFLVDSVNTQLHLVDKYNYDGVIMGFNAKLTHYLNDQEKAEVSL